MNINEKIKQVKAVGDPEELLELLGKEYFEEIDVSYRGGTLGFYAETIADFTGIDKNLLPSKFGAYCNYLGGGLRGTINKSDFSEDIKGKERKLLDELNEAIVRCYNFYEQEDGLQAEECQDGEINWENRGTNRSREAGIVSAY